MKTQINDQIKNRLINTVQTEFNVENILLNQPANIYKKQKTQILKNIILTERDYEVLKFILDMKFSSIHEVNEKYFKSSNSICSEVRNSYALKRMSKLEKDGLLKSTRAFDATKRLYFVTQKAYKILTQIYPDQNLIRPIRNIDGRTVVHDYYLLRLRLKLESEFKIKSWISDRRLKVENGLYSRLGEGNTPDAIYCDYLNQPFAFELEISVKAKSRYQDKIKKYVQIIREHRNSLEVFKKVHYIVFSDVTYKHLVEYTNLYKDFFKIEMATAYNLENGVFV